MVMTKKQAQMLKETNEIAIKTFAMVDHLLNKIQVNGEDGSMPIIGAEKIHEAHHKEIKIINKDLVAVHSQLSELKSVAQPLYTRQDVRKSIKTIFFALVTSVSFWAFLIGFILVYVAVVHPSSYTTIFENIAKTLKAMSSP